jgi:hypothetical protein
MYDGSLTIGVAWNGVGELHQLLERVRSLDWVEEVLVSPSSEAAKRKVEDLSVIYSKLRSLPAGDTGIYSAYNKLIFGARTSHLCFHGCDDFLVPDPRLGKIIKEASPEELLVFTLRFCTAEGEFLTSAHHVESTRPRVALGRYASPATPEVAYPVKILQAVGGADESFRIAGDADLYFKVREKSVRRDFDLEFAEMRDGGASTAAKHAWTVYRENRKIAKRYRQKLTIPQRAVALAALGGRAAIFKLGGERMSNEVTDSLRRLAGRPARFTRR